MVKKAKDYVDYANQIQVTSGFGYNTAIAKSKETQALWSKTLDNLSDSLMKGAVAVESAKQKRLSEQIEFDVDEKEITDEDGNKYVQKTYNKIKEPLFLFNKNQEAYDKTVFMELQNNVMADAREITSRIQADVISKNQNPQQYIGRSSVMLDELVKNLPSKFTKVIVVNKDNPYWFDAFLDKIHAASPLHLQVVDDNKHMDLMDDADVENVEDTLTILTKYVDSMDIQGKKKPLTELMTSLYNEALDEHTFI